MILAPIYSLVAQPTTFKLCFGGSSPNFCSPQNFVVYRKFIINIVFLKENVKYLVWTFRNPIFSDSRDPIVNSRDPNRVPKTP